VLYGRLLEDLRDMRFRCAMGGIALPNDASIALHQAMGFVKVAHFRDVGFKFDRWIDVAYWQRML
jgi:L-amino acid N-acyltransferase YncA